MDNCIYLTFEQNIARLVIGDISMRSMPDIALQALEQGLDTPSLRILAGLSDNENEFVIEGYVNETLQDLSIELPDTRQAAIQVGLAIADEIFKGKRKIFEGVQEIKWKSIDAYPFFEENKHYCYDSISFEKAYGLFVTIDDLRHTGTSQWQPGKTNQELEQELSQELFAELKEWSLRMKNGKTCH
jgi:hypothetical protein